MSDVVDGVWSVVVRYAGKECMFVMAPVRYNEGELEELPVEFTRAQEITAVHEKARALEARVWENELNGGPCRKCYHQANEEGLCACDLVDDDVDDIAAEEQEMVVDLRREEQTAAEDCDLPF